MEPKEASDQPSNQVAIVDDSKVSKRKSVNPATLKSQMILQNIHTKSDFVSEWTPPIGDTVQPPQRNGSPGQGDEESLSREPKGGKISSYTSQRFKSTHRSEHGSMTPDFANSQFENSSLQNYLTEPSGEKLARRGSFSRHTIKSKVSFWCHFWL